MNQETFILAKTKPFRQGINIFIKKADGKVDKKLCEFTTEHLVTETDRVAKARKTHAEYTTHDPVLIDAMLRDTGYGKTFHLKSDPEGKKKLPSFDLTKLDAEKMALQNLFDLAGLPFDGTKNVEVLRHEFQIFTQSKGIDASKSTATKIEHEEVDVASAINSTVEAAKVKYVSETGEAFPVFSNRHDELSFIDGLSVPEFDTAAFIAEKAVKEEEGLPESLDDLQSLYQQRFKKTVPNLKKNDPEWIKAKLRGED